MKLSTRQQLLGVKVLFSLAAVFIAANVLAQANPESPGKPVTITFLLETNGSPVANFEQCTGMGSENDIVEHKVVDKDGHELTRKIPGRLAWTDIHCEKVISADTSLWDWRDLVVAGDMNDARRHVTISMMDAGGTVLASWNVMNAWPSKLVGGSNGSPDDAVEAITLVHEGLVRAF